MFATDAPPIADYVHIAARYSLLFRGRTHHRTHAWWKHTLIAAEVDTFDAIADLTFGPLIVPITSTNLLTLVADYYAIHTVTYADVSAFLSAPHSLCVRAKRIIAHQRLHSAFSFKDSNTSDVWAIDYHLHRDRGTNFNHSRQKCDFHSSLGKLKDANASWRLEFSFFSLRGGGCGVSSQRKTSKVSPLPTMRLFVQNPESRPESYTSKISNLRDLATFLRLRYNDPLWGEYHDRAHRAIRIFSARFHKLEHDYLEISVLSTSDCKQLTKNLVAALIDEFDRSPTLGLSLLICLRNVLVNLQIEHVDTDQLERLLRILLQHHDVFYNPDVLATPTFITTYTILLDVIHLALPNTFPKKQIPSELTRKFVDILQQTNPLAQRCHAALGLEVLSRLSWKEMKIASFVKTNYHVTLGLLFSPNSATRKEPLTLVKSFESLERLSRSTPAVDSWYENYKIMTLLILNNLYCEAEDYLLKMDVERKSVYFCFHLSILLHDRATSHYIPEIQTACVKMIASMYLDQPRWCEDHQFRKHIFKMLVSLARHQSEPIRRTSISCLTQIHTVIHEDPHTQKLVTKHMPDGPHCLSSRHPLAFEEKFPTSIFEESGRKERAVGDVLEDVKREILMNEDFARRLSVYVPPTVIRVRERSQVHEAEKMITDFLAGPKRILFIFGDEGSGKTVLAMHTVKKLWGQWTKGETIPFYISLTTLSRFDSGMIEDALKSSWKNSVKPSKRSLGFSELQIDDFRKSKQSFTFILDACDEVYPGKNHISISKCVAQWNCKVIVCCRTASPVRENMTHSYSFYDLDYGPERDFIEDIMLCPFNEKQRHHFLKEYMKAYPKSTITIDAFDSLLCYIPEVRDLAGNPFVLFMVATAFPNLYPKYQESLSGSLKLKLSRIDVFKEFLTVWFGQEKQTILQQQLHHNLPPPVLENMTVEMDCFCTQLAGVLHHRKALSSTVNDHSGSQSPHDIEFDRFMSSNPAFLIYLRQAAPIVMISESNCEFIHHSLFEYYLSEYIHDKLMKIVAKAMVFDHIKRIRGIEVREEPWEALDTALDEGVLRNLSRRAASEKSFQKELFDIVRQSKDDPRKSHAASNAITILNFAQVSFTVMDLRGIRIPRANLSRALLESVNLSDADLTEVNFSEAYLSNAILENADLNGCNFGQIPIMYGHTNYVWSVCSATNSMEKPLIASASWDRTIKVWSLETGDVVYNLTGHSDYVNSVCYVEGHEGGHLLATGGKDETICLWDLDNGSLHRRFENLGSAVNVVCAVRGPIGEKWIASGHYDCSLRVRDIASGTEIRRFYGHTQAVYCLTPLRGPSREKWIASGSSDTTVRIWDLAKGKEVRQLIGHDTAIFCLCRLEGPNGEEWLATSGEDRSIWIWDVHKGLGVRMLRGHTESVNSLCCAESQSGLRLLVSCSEDYSIRVWDISTGDEVRQLNGHSQSVLSVCTVQGLRKGVWVASGSWDRTVRVWNIDPHQSLDKPRVYGHQGYVNAICPLPGPNKEKWIASGSEDRTVRIWDTYITKEVAKFDGFAGPVFAVCAIEDVDGRRKLAVAGCDEIITVLDPLTRREVLQLEGHVDNVNCLCVAVSPNGRRWLVSGGEDRTVRLWDIETCKQVRLYTNQREAVTCLCLVEGVGQDRWLAFNGDGHAIVLWDFMTGHQVGVLRTHTDLVSALCFVQGPKDRHFLVSGSHDCTICVWDLSIGRVLHRLQGHTDWIRCICELEGPFGRKWLASGSYDRSVRLWDFQAGLEVMRFDQHSGAVLGICLSTGPHGEKRLVSAGLDRSVRIWDISMGGSSMIWKGIASKFNNNSLVGPNDYSVWGTTISHGRSDSSSGYNVGDIYVGGMIRIYGDRVLQCRGMNLTGCKNVCPRDRYLLFQSGAYASEPAFVEFCDLYPYTKCQALRISRMYEEGNSIEVDAQKARIWREKSAAMADNEEDPRNPSAVHQSGATSDDSSDHGASGDEGGHEEKHPDASQRFPKQAAAYPNTNALYRSSTSRDGHSERIVDGSVGIIPSDHAKRPSSRQIVQNMSYGRDISGGEGIHRPLTGTAATLSAISGIGELVLDSTMGHDKHGMNYVDQQPNLQSSEQASKSAPRKLAPLQQRTNGVADPHTGLAGVESTKATNQIPALMSDLLDPTLGGAILSSEIGTTEKLQGQRVIPQSEDVAVLKKESVAKDVKPLTTKDALPVQISHDALPKTVS
eukprot:TRINITY_DN9752_c0_g1_i1.p1 TRINITY_DN9752_c0_g1~~TRINITY_DN9752_c0_g1_i1.p1  ORF type:complete len:2198 (+),score=378.02 TRINITY_DN9752_c0_g1_i1:187-6780(+)